MSNYRRLYQAADAGQVIKPGPGVVTEYYIGNTSSSARYVKFYDKATAPTIGTDTPYRTIYLPGSSAANLNNSPPAVPVKDGSSGQPWTFTNGISYGVTANPADNDSTAPSNNDIIINLTYG